jgi:hypothetical protein
VISQSCFFIAACDIVTQNMNCERFFIISTFSKAIESLRLHFLKFFLQTKNFFLTHLLYAKSTFNRDRKLYKKKLCDRCELDYLILTEIDLLFKLIISRFVNKLSQIIIMRSVDKLLQIIVAKFVDTKMIIRRLMRHEIE